MFVRIAAGAVAGIDAVTVSVEVNVAAAGQLELFWSGCPTTPSRRANSASARPSKTRGRMTGKKLVVNLLRPICAKEGGGGGSTRRSPWASSPPRSRFRPRRSTGRCWRGELSLDGTLKPVRGIPMAVKAREEGLRRLIVPCDNACEAAVVEGVEVIGAASLGETVEYLRGDRTIAPAAAPAAFAEEEGRLRRRFRRRQGQAAVKRALEIAAAGGHNVLMIGAPGSGKTMLARRLPSILPPLTLDEALETTKIHSVAGKIGAHRGLLAGTALPRTPRTTSRAQVALIGGGQSPCPGEVSLAHSGILFSGRGCPNSAATCSKCSGSPSKSGVSPSRGARYSVEYPANFTLVAAMNPCPCGYWQPSYARMHLPAGCRTIAIWAVSPARS